MLAAAEINATAATTADSRGETSDRSDQGTRTTSSSDQTMELTASAAARSKGFSVGLTGTNSNSATLSLDPILSLVRAVTGAFQLGYNSSSVTNTAVTTGDMLQRLSSGLDQATSQLRIDNAAAMSDAVNQLSDRRRLRALRNATGAQTLNLAVFAVNRQWLVTTAHLRTRDVMLIPVEKFDQAFAEEEIFLYAEVLTGVLLDRSLSDSLNRVAQAYVPAKAQPAPAAPGVRNLRFGYTIDGAPRPDAHASVQAHLVTNGNDGRSVASVLPLGTGSHEVTVFLDRPLSTLTRLMIKYDSGHFPHHSITLKGITVVAELDDRSTQQLAVELTNLSIEHEGTSTLDFTGFTWARPTTATNRDVARVKTHLDANRSYYRLAIDLQRSDISRFTDSTFWRNAASDKQTDPHPVGIAGAHLAFLCNEQSNTTTEDRRLRATSQLLSVPTGATFLDALPGALKLKVPEKSDLAQPTVLAPASATIAWPTVVQPTALTTTRAAAAPAATGATALATSTLPDLAAQITAFAAKLDAIQASLTKVQTDVQKAIPAAPTAPAKDAGAAKAKGGTDGAATTKADT